MSNNKQTAIYFALASAFALGSSQVQASNGNTFYGHSALASVTTGDTNSAFGDNSMLSTTTRSSNTASGA